jgi:hypothetical protein
MQGNEEEKTVTHPAVEEATPIPEPTELDLSVDPTEETEVPFRLDESADMADRIFRKLTVSGAGALDQKKQIIPRRVRTFILEGQCCSPDVFVDEVGDYFDFKVTMRSLSSQEEITALNGVNDPGQVPYMLARACLYAINGKPIPADRKDFFWEAFGQGGRQICLMAFQHVGSASGSALGKFRRSISAA